MGIENQMPKCPYCGGIMQPEPMGGIVRRKCQYCGYVELSNDLSAKESLESRYHFVLKANKIASDMLNHLNDPEKINWQDTFFDSKKEDVVEFLQSPLYGMLYSAWLSKGFRKINSRAKTALKTVYESAKAYTNNTGLSVLKMLVNLYEDATKKKKRKRTVILSLAGITVVSIGIGGFLAMQTYSPVVTDANTGIAVSISGDAISILDKWNVDIHVEKQPSNSAAYIDAKNALHNETEKFELYDLALKNGNKLLALDGTVTVEIPIPQGYQPGALKIYHVISDEEFEEIPATVSAAKNTISFSTTHFSYYAVAERHPIVAFDTNGAGEIDRQIVERDSLAQKPEDPRKAGYTFVGWKVGSETWNFSVNTVKKDMTLVAQWVPNEYTITLVANGGVISSDTLTISYHDTYAALPTDVVKDGYTFLGWYTATENGVLITNDRVMETAADQTLYAVFRENVNKIIFHANGGSGTMEDLELKTGASAKLPQCAFAKVGYTFMGWSTSVTGDVVYTDRT